MTDKTAHTLSQGVRKGPFVQVSGQGPVDPATNEYVYPGDVAAQTTRTLQNVRAIIDASGYCPPGQRFSPARRAEMLVEIDAIAVTD